MKLVKHVLEDKSREMADVDKCSLVLSLKTDAIFIIRQLQEKYISVKKPLYFTFADMEKASDRVPRKVI